MRFVVVGAGAIGGLVGGRLAQHGHDVLLVARGPHGARMAAKGLLIRSPEDEVRVSVPVVDHPAAVDLGVDDVVLLAVKGQDTPAALGALTHGPSDLPIACLQNGVDNERQALRRTSRVYAVPVMSPAAQLEPGIVDCYSAPVNGILDVGRYPTGVDETATAISSAFASSGFSSLTNPTVMRFKWSKLLMNLHNALEAACGPGAHTADLYLAARLEGLAVLDAAGIDVATEEEEAARRGSLISLRRIAGERRGGGSSWQSLARGTRSIEVDWLNGEIVRLGREHEVPTPVNEVLQQAAHELSRTGAEPGSMTPAELVARLPLGIL